MTAPVMVTALFDVIVGVVVAVKVRCGVTAAW
jgi:hypothetical protein